MHKKKSSKVGIIIQARMTSQRLPGKVMQKISGKPMLWHIVERLKHSKLAQEVILAIPDNKQNDILEDFAQKNRIKYFRGSEKDVLSRFLGAAKKFKIDVTVRICSDDPLIDPEIVDYLVEKHLKSRFDCTSNVMERTFPRGLDVEVLNFKTIEKADKEAKGGHNREHVTPYIYFHPELFKIQNIKAEKRLRRPDLRWAVDEKKDIELVKKIYKHLYRPQKIFYSDQIIDLLNKNPELAKINFNVKQKSFWFKSS